MGDAVIIDAVRTLIGALGGELGSVRPDDLAAHELRALVDRTGIDPAVVEEGDVFIAGEATIVKWMV